MLYLYGIARHRKDGELLSAVSPGLGNAVVRMLPWREVAAIVSPVAMGEVVVTADTLWRHEQVVEGVMAETPILPLRFGTVLDDADACRRRLRRQYSELMEMLAHVAGRVEFGLRLRGRFLCEPPVEPLPSSVVPPTPAPIGPGTAYLRARAAASGWPCGLDVMVRRALDPWAVASVLWPRETPASDLRASFLVERPVAESFRRAVAGMTGVAGAGSGGQDLAMFCTGPWPPYSFVNDSTAIPGAERGRDDHA